ncbi:hypothetical protein CMALT430_180027 [Carnobacterium maltaromaticum]|nr:hypothetical protein CMALT430_180027 [Carnobacterium maltaromaticum]CAD5900574.1 hypothetical protein CMALT394_300048 [Carnobacterium maltaromaticum]
MSTLSSIPNDGCGKITTLYDYFNIICLVSIESKSYNLNPSINDCYLI